MSKPTEAIAVVVETRKPKKPPPLDVWLVFAYASEDVAWTLQRHWSPLKAQQSAIEQQKYGTHTRTVHVTDKAPGADKGLRELLRWSDGRPAVSPEATILRQEFRKKIRESLKEPTDA